MPLSFAGLRSLWNSLRVICCKLSTHMGDYRKNQRVAASLIHINSLHEDESGWFIILRQVISDDPANS